MQNKPSTTGTRRTGGVVPVVAYVHSISHVVSNVIECRLKANPAGSGSGVPAIVADVFIARPLGIMATLAGSALYVVSLPFTVPARGTEQAKRVLVAYPFHYTFSRPLGEFHDDDF